MSGFSLKNLGTFPREYNARVHGAYNPATNYKVDTAFKNVKLGEMGAWLSRRPLNPFPAIGRTYQGYMQRWMWPRKAGLAGVFQVVMFASFYFYVTTYGFIKHHRHMKYH